MRVNLWIQVFDRGFQGVSSFCFLYFNQIRRPSKYKTEKILILYFYALEGSTWDRHLSRNALDIEKQSFQGYCCESGIAILALRSFEIMLKVLFITWNCTEPSQKDFCPRWSKTREMFGDINAGIRHICIVQILTKISSPCCGINLTDPIVLYTICQIFGGIFSKSLEDFNFRQSRRFLSRVLEHFQSVDNTPNIIKFHFLKSTPKKCISCSTFIM